MKFEHHRTYLQDIISGRELKWAEYFHDYIQAGLLGEHFIGFTPSCAKSWQKGSRNVSFRVC